MDGARFDGLIKRLATAHLTRGQALRGLAAGGVAALTGVTLAGDEAAAGNTKKVKVCHCHGANANVCTQGKVKIKKGTDQGKRKAAKLRKHLKNNPCDYKGTCQPVNPLCGTAAAGGGGGGGGGGTDFSATCPSDGNFICDDTNRVFCGPEDICTCTLTDEGDPFCTGGQSCFPANQCVDDDDCFENGIGNPDNPPGTRCITTSGPDCTGCTRQCAIPCGSTVG